MTAPVPDYRESERAVVAFILTLVVVIGAYLAIHAMRYDRCLLPVPVLAWPTTAECLALP